MRMGQGARTGLGHGGITCVLQTQFSSFHFFSLIVFCFYYFYINKHEVLNSEQKNRFLQ